MRSAAGFKKEVNALSLKGYRDIVSLGGQNSDWVMQSLSEDADLWQNAYALTSRVRDLFKTNPIYVKYRELLWANVFGENGIMLRMKIKETEDRVIHTPDEKLALIAYERRINRLREFAAQRDGRDPIQVRAYKLVEAMERSKPEDILERKAKIQVGDPDVFANVLIERKYNEWQRAEFCDIRGKRNYHVLRQMRLINGIRDGDFFLRMISDPKANKFGFTLQLIASEWCDRFLNVTLPNGNVVIMGIEYQMSEWGIGKAVAYYFIKRMPSDWQFSSAGMFGNMAPAGMHQRVDASEIIHYARPVDAESTRPAPWVASTIPKGRQLDQYELAEVIAAREAACKVGFLWSDVMPEGGLSGTPVDPSTGLPAARQAGPGDTVGLPYGVKYQQNDPKHPTQNFEAFRKEMVRSITAGMPGADYNTIANDLENINFSAGRLGRLDTNEMSKMIQRFDIDVAETPIFERWLEMALLTQAVALPLVKFDKFNKPLFTGRRWAAVDEIKEVNAAALRVANGFSCDQDECADFGKDFEETAMSQAEANMFKESLGLETSKTVENVKPAEPAEDTEAGETGAATGGTTKPAAKKTVKASNGAHEEES